MSASLPNGRFFDQDTDDVEADVPYLEPLAGIEGLPPVSTQYTESARFLEHQESGMPLAEVASAASVVVQ